MSADMIMSFAKTTFTAQKKITVITTATVLTNVHYLLKMDTVHIRYEKHYQV